MEYVTTAANRVILPVLVPVVECAVDSAEGGADSDSNLDPEYRRMPMELPSSASEFLIVPCIRIRIESADFAESGYADEYGAHDQPMQWRESPRERLLGSAQ